MNDLLIKKLHAYLVLNNPDILVVLQEDSKVRSYLEEKVHGLDGLLEQLQANGKPLYIIEEICMEELTKAFRPSKYNYLLSLLEDDFYAEYCRWQESGILTYEIINLLKVCNPLFDSFEFTEENEENRVLRYAIIRGIQQHLTGVTVDAEYLDNIDLEGDPSAH
jgi:hypothetical protein